MNGALMDTGSIHAFLRSISSNRWEITALTLIMVVTVLLRTVNLTGLPEGFHGDEALVGLEAQRILRDGYIGPYSPYAAGQPTGPMYLTALSVSVFGNTVMAVRIVPALLGSLTVFVLYIVMRRNLDPRMALIGASILAVMSWHIHFARLGIPLEAWPLVAILIVGSLAEAMRRHGWRWWIVAGALTGSGIYVYNAHVLLIAIVMLAVAVYVVVNRSVSLRRDLAGITLFALALLVILIPMAHFALQEDSIYRVHFERDRVTETEEWLELDGASQQVRFLAGRYRDIWNRHCCEPELDLVDGSGTTILTPPLMLWLAGMGMLVGLWRYRSPLICIGVLVVVLMPLGPALTVGGVVRRTLVSAPFIAMFCAIAAVGVFDLMQPRQRTLLYSTATLATLVLVLIGYQNITLYFREFAKPEIQREILGAPMANASKYLRDNGHGSYVYFYSNTWSIDHVIRRYLAPHIDGEDRSERFGRYHFQINEQNGKPLMVFLGRYLNDIETARDLYDGNETTPADMGDNPGYRVYEPVLKRQSWDDMLQP